MSKSYLKYDYNDQTEQIMNETFKKFEALINSSNNRKKKKQCTNYLVNIFERTLSNNVSIESHIKSIEE